MITVQICLSCLQCETEKEGGGTTRKLLEIFRKKNGCVIVKKNRFLVIVAQTNLVLS